MTGIAIEMIGHIGKKYGKKNYEILRELILGLEFEPEKKGQALRSPLNGLHSLHYSRFRVVYRIKDTEAQVLVLAAGHHASGQRDDIYQVIQRMIDEGIIQISKKRGE